MHVRSESTERSRPQSRNARWRYPVLGKRRRAIRSLVRNDSHGRTDLNIGALEKVTRTGSDYTAIKVSHNSNYLFLPQRRYIDKALVRYGFQDCKPADTEARGGRQARRRRSEERGARRRTNGTPRPSQQRETVPAAGDAERAAGRRPAPRLARRSEAVHSGGERWGLRRRRRHAFRVETTASSRAAARSCGCCCTRRRRRGAAGRMRRLRARWHRVSGRCRRRLFGRRCHRSVKALRRRRGVADLRVELLHQGAQLR